MITRDDTLWFKEQFAAQIVPALRDTPFTVDFLTAIACQETGHIWSSLRRTPLTVDEILATCVGDVIDAPGRKAFPFRRRRSSLNATARRCSRSPAGRWN